MPVELSNLEMNINKAMLTDWFVDFDAHTRRTQDHTSGDFQFFMVDPMCPSERFYFQSRAGTWV